MAFQELKQRQSVMWGNGPYQRITETIVDIHETVVERLAPEPGDDLLDLACGTGAVAELAAARGARVTGVDLAPVLVETAKARAGELGLDLRDHVRTRPRGRRPRAGARRAARGSDRAGELDAHGRPGEDVQGDGAVPGGAAAEQPVRLG